MSVALEAIATGHIGRITHPRYGSLIQRVKPHEGPNRHIRRMNKWAEWLGLGNGSKHAAGRIGQARNKQLRTERRRAIAEASRKAQRRYH